MTSAPDVLPAAMPSYNANGRSLPKEQGDVKLNGTPPKPTAAAQQQRRPRSASSIYARTRQTATLTRLAWSWPCFARRAACSAVAAPCSCDAKRSSAHGQAAVVKWDDDDMAIMVENTIGVRLRSVSFGPFCARAVRGAELCEACLDPGLDPGLDPVCACDKRIAPMNQIHCGWTEPVGRFSLVCLPIDVPFFRCAAALLRSCAASLRCLLALPPCVAS